MKALSAIILAGGIVISGFLLGGRYDSHVRESVILVVDRYTGEVRVCWVSGCKTVQDQESD